MDPPASLEPAALLAARKLTAPVLDASLAALPPPARLITCANLVLAGRVYDPALLRRVVDLGLDGAAEDLVLLQEDVRERLGAAPAPAPKALAGARTAPAPEDLEEDSAGAGWEGWSRAQVYACIDSAAGADEARGVLVRCLAILHEARRRLDTYDILVPPAAVKRAAPAPAQAPAPTRAQEDADMDLDDPWAGGEDDDPWANAENDDPWANADGDGDGDGDVPPMLDDPWGNVDNASDAEPSTPVPAGASSPPSAAEPPMDLPSFVLGALPIVALSLAASANIAALRTVCERYAAELMPFRLAIVEAIPDWVSPAEGDMAAVLPGVGADGEMEGPWPRGAAASGAAGGAGGGGGDSGAALLDCLVPHLGISASNTVSPALLPSRQRAALPAAALTDWYMERVMAIDDLGLLDVQLAWVQHGAALGVPRLDAAGEDLSLLSRLIYDAHLPPAAMETWSLASWRAAAATPGDIVTAYLAGATPATVVGDLRRLVLPYLYVLESRAERAGTADPGLVERMLNDALLALPLPLALPCFEASKATVPASQRLIKNDQAVARLALAILYGSDAREAWGTMSAIFECLPVWDVSGGDPESDREAMATTLDSIAAYIRPTTTSAGQHSPRDLFLFFSPLPFSSLSRALDILDVHLESGEILARWDVPVYLRTLIQAARDHGEQELLADKMARRAARPGAAAGAPAADERRWVALWQDMCKLQGGDDALLRGAFGMLHPAELMRIFLGGLLSSGNFATAKRVIRRLQPEGHFTAEGLEAVVLNTSHEFYMRAETGNIHTGDMKLAHECVAPDTPAIAAERAFIHATSRLSSFRALSSLTPAEIRHVPDRLALVRRVLAGSDDAWQHPHIILELADGLGLGSDPAARTQVLGMMADAALRNGEWDFARMRVEEMVALVEPDLGGGEADWMGGSRSGSGSSGGSGRSSSGLARSGSSASSPASIAASAEKARGVVWRACLGLGSAEGYPDLGARLALLAHALAYCPADEVPVILPHWRAVETEVARGGAVWSPRLASPTSASPAPAPVPEERMLGSRRAMRAARLAIGIGNSWRHLAASPGPGASAGSPGSLGTSPHGAHGPHGPHGLGLARVDSRDSRTSRTSTDSRRDANAAALFDFDRSAPGEDGDGVRAGVNRALVKGVGWLLGADERER